jgi:hypothetical protein
MLALHNSVSPHSSDPEFVVFDVLPIGSSISTWIPELQFSNPTLRGIMFRVLVWKVFQLFHILTILNWPCWSDQKGMIKERILGIHRTTLYFAIDATDDRPRQRTELGTRLSSKRFRSLAIPLIFYPLSQIYTTYELSLNASQDAHSGKSYQSPGHQEAIRC